MNGSVSPASERLLAEGIGSAFLLMAVVGSGIMGERLAGGNIAVALLANSLATGFALAVLIFAIGPISGAHFNPLVTVGAAVQGSFRWNAVVPYVLAQVTGAVLGVVSTHVMFGLPVVERSLHVRSGIGQWWSEAVATFGLLMVIRAGERGKGAAAPLAVGGYIAAAYWFTASTSFANPSVTIARMLTDTFAGISPGDVPAFIGAQTIGAGSAWVLSRKVSPTR